MPKGSYVPFFVCNATSEDARDSFRLPIAACCSRWSVCCLAALSPGGLRVSRRATPRRSWPSQPIAARLARRRSGQGQAPRVVPRGEVRPLHPLGPLRHSRGRVEGPAHSRHRRVDHESRADSGEGIRAARQAVQSRQVQRRRMGAARQRRGHEIHRHHRQASRRLRAVRLEGQQVRHRRCDAVQARCAEGAGGGLREARHAPGLLLFAGAGLARAQRRRQHLGLSRRRNQEGLRSVPARQGGAAGARAADRLRPGRAHLVRHAAADDRAARAAIRRHAAIGPARTRSSTAGWAWPAIT